MSALKPPVSEADDSSGPLDAPVTLLEYGDYECPHCGRAFPIVHEVRKRLGARLRFVFRNFPLKEAHEHAEHAAEAAQAAGAQGRFWEMHEAIFRDQGHLEDRDLVARARKLGLDVTRFEQELETGVHAKKVRGDFRSGVRSGVNGTPTFFINGTRYDGSWELEPLLEALEAAAE